MSVSTNWPRVALHAVCNPLQETRDPRRTPSNEFRYVDIASVDRTRKQIVSSTLLLGSDAPSRARKVIRSHDVIVSTTRPNLNAVAMVSPDLDSQICSTGFCVLRSMGEIDPTYLFALVRSPGFVNALTDLTSGALYPAVSDRDVLAQSIPLPPLPEQKRIAAELDAQMALVERARAATEAELRAISLLPAALLREVFGDETNHG